MAVVLSQNSYGKSRVRLTKVNRGADRHELIEWSVDIQLGGDFAATYTAGDNRKVVATDTMKNTVYILARDHALSSPEEFAHTIARHFLDRYSQVESAMVRIAATRWERIQIDGRPHPHAFIGGHAEERTARIEMSRTATQATAGIDNLFLLKTTDSAFRDFHRDDFTTLPNFDDRILATVLKVEWHYCVEDADWDTDHAGIRSVLLETFAGHFSLSVQQTLLALGAAALEACPTIDEIALTMPNRHRLLVNLAQFGRDNPNEIFVATDEPFGLISGTVRRETR